MREKAVDTAMEKAILFEEQKGEAKRVVMVDEEVEDDVKEVNKAHGIEAFAAGEYVQALLLRICPIADGWREQFELGPYPCLNTVADMSCMGLLVQLHV